MESRERDGGRKSKKIRIYTKYTRNSFYKEPNAQRNAHKATKRWTN